MVMMDVYRILFEIQKKLGFFESVAQFIDANDFTLLFL